MSTDTIFPKTFASERIPDTVNITDFIDDRPISKYQWLLVAICFLVVVADGMDVAIIGFVTPSILQEWDISRPVFGVVISAAPFGLVLGALVGRTSLRQIWAQSRPDRLCFPVRAIDVCKRTGDFADSNGNSASRSRHGHGSRHAERLDASVGICAPTKAIVDLNAFAPGC
jgi:hypothetical protein